MKASVRCENLLTPLAIDVEPPLAKAAPSLRVNAQINPNVAAMTDVELEDYRELLQELKALMPAEAPKVIEGIVTR
jgi:hypothetical protein